MGGKIGGKTVPESAGVLGRKQKKLDLGSGVCRERVGILYQVQTRNLSRDEARKKRKRKKDR